MRYAAQQKEAIRLACERRLLAVTGGPGTGKTTIIQAILRLYDDMQLDCLLAAPTGRAAKRMTELTGREAYTIHRLLGAGRGPPRGTSSRSAKTRAIRSAAARSFSTNARWLT